MCCEKCWTDAYIRSLSSGRSQAEEYRDLLEARARNEKPCSKQEQAGQFWDERRGCDSRKGLK